ncbi:MAG: hypothetical protein M0R70_06725 [Nitrospirae bacterium]|nr:hypothetical protein [Nitrospirota bacterium]
MVFVLLLKNRERFIAVRRTLRLLRWCLAMLVVLPVLAHAATGSGSFSFSQGSARLAIHAGGATAFDRNYSVLGIGGGYFVADGLEVGLDAETWFGASPGITRVSPQVRFVLNTAGPFNPYAGIFYQRTFIQNNPDNDTVGGRTGVYYSAGRNACFGVGVVHASHVRCDRTVYSSCAETYPEISFSVLFR